MFSQQLFYHNRIAHAVILAPLQNYEDEAVMKYTSILKSYTPMDLNLIYILLINDQNKFITAIKLRYQEFRTKMLNSYVIQQATHLESYTFLAFLLNQARIVENVPLNPINTPKAAIFAWFDYTSLQKILATNDIVLLRRLQWFHPALHNGSEQQQNKYHVNEYLMQLLLKYSS